MDQDRSYSDFTGNVECTEDRVFQEALTEPLTFKVIIDRKTTDNDNGYLRRHAV